MSTFKQKSKDLVNLLPHNFLAEKMLLGCLIYHPESIEVARQNLSVNSFYFRNHQELYNALLEMEKQKLVIDLVTVTIFLQNKGVLEIIGGINVLYEIGRQPLAFSYFNEYIRIVKEKFLKRCLIKFGYSVINSGYLTNLSFEENLARIENEFFDLTSGLQVNEMSNAAEILNDLFAELKNKFLNPQLPGLPSGFDTLDEVTQGFQKSDLIIIAGRPSMGKTALSLNIALNCIKTLKLPVLFCSLEMSKEQILYRLLSNETNINQMKLRSGKLTSEEWIQLTTVMRKLATLPFFVDDRSTLSTQDVRSKIKMINFEHDQLGLIIIDYIQLMTSTLNSKQNNRVQELSQITRDLKGLAREFNVPIIALSQLSRNVDNRINQRPILSDLRESGSIEQDADLILMLSGSKVVSSTNSLNESTNLLTTELIIAKQRNGPTGTIKLQFDKDKIQFTELN